MLTPCLHCVLLFLSRLRTGRQGVRRNPFGNDNRATTTKRLSGSQRSKPVWRGGGVSDDPAPKGGKKVPNYTISHDREYTTMPFMMSKRARDAGHYSTVRSSTARSTTSSADSSRDYDRLVAETHEKQHCPFLSADE